MKPWALLGAILATVKGLDRNKLRTIWADNFSSCIPCAIDGKYTRLPMPHHALRG